MRRSDLTAPALPFLAWLTGVDAAVNALGIFREQPGASFDILHTRLPVALFTACKQAAVQRVVQLSAQRRNGATAQRRNGAGEPFLRSKYEADEYLLALPLNAMVVQPSLVFGSDGASSRQLLVLASLPVLLLPAGGMQRVQPIHVDDVVAALCTLLVTPASDTGLGAERGRLPLVGPQALTLKSYLMALRRGLGLGAVLRISVPGSLMVLGARLANHLPSALLSRDSWSMLQRGSTASAGPITARLGRPARAPQHFIAPEGAPGLRLRAAIAWLLPVLRLSAAVVWIVTAIVSMGVFPIDDSLDLLARAGVPMPLQLPALYGAAALDLAFGEVRDRVQRSPAVVSSTPPCS